MKSIFLESHNLKNLSSGFGVFNYELIKAIAKLHPEDLDITLNLKHPNQLKSQFGTQFRYKKYIGLHRTKFFRTGRRYDVWHSMNQNTRIEPAKKQKKYILTIHDVNFAEDVQNKGNIERANRFKQKLKWADEITYISNYAKSQTHKHFEIPNCTEKIIYNGNPITSFIDTTTYQPEIAISKPYFYSIGDFLEKKNFTSIVRMMALIPDYQLILSGNDQKSYGETVKNLIAELHLEKRVLLTGRVSEQGKQYYLKNCEAFLFPSVAEGFGLPPIEAMSFGKPVFLSTLASLPEIGGDVAYYWEHFDPEYMKEELFQRLHEFHQNAAQFELKLKQRASFFSWDKAAELYLDRYRN